MCGFPLFVKIAIFYLAATSEGVPLLENVRSDDVSESDESTHAFEGAISSQEEEPTEPSASLSVINASVPFKGAVSCNQRSDCDEIMVCLPSKICGCPELTPVLLQEVDGIVCVSPKPSCLEYSGAARRLHEFCLNDDECRYGDEHARCLDSACSCQSRFYASTDGSTCLPEPAAGACFGQTYSYVWSPLRTAVLPAALLILGLISLGVLGYRRLRKPLDDKVQCTQQMTSPPRHAGCSSRERPSTDSDSSLVDQEGRANESRWNWLRSFVSSVTCRPQSAKCRCRWSYSDRNPPCGNLPTRTPVSRFITPTEHSDHNGTPPQAASVLHPTPSNTSNDTSLQIMSVASIAMQTSRSTASHAVDTATYPESRQEQTRPLPSPRTRISTLSTTTLMPCNRASRRGNHSSSSASSTLPTVNYGHPRAVWPSGMCDLGGPIEERSTDEQDWTATIQARTPEFIRFTESELQGGNVRVLRSEELAMPTPARLRRVVSDRDEHVEMVRHESYAAVFSDKQEESSSCCCCGHSCPNVHFYGSSIESSSKHGGCNALSCTKLSCDEHGVQEGVKVLFTRSQPTWPCERVVCKGPDRKARTCEAFTVYGKESLPEDRSSLFGPPLIHQDPQDILLSGAYSPAGMKGSDSRYPGVVTRCEPSIGAQSAAAGKVQSQFPSSSIVPSTVKRNSGTSRKSGESSRSPWSTERRLSLARRADSTPQVAQVAPFSRSSQPLGSEREIGVQCTDPRISDGSTISPRATL